MLSSGVSAHGVGQHIGNKVSCVSGNIARSTSNAFPLARVHVVVGATVSGISYEPASVAIEHCLSSVSVHELQFRLASAIVVEDAL